MKKMLLAMLVLGVAGALRAQDFSKLEAELAVEKPAEKSADKPAEKPTEKPAEQATPKFLVILPEEVDGVWYWSYFTTESQHIVQSAVEKKLVDAGLDVVDLSTLKMNKNGSLDSLMGTAGAVAQAKEAGAAYVIVGKATAVNGGTSVAYGVTVTRMAANLTAKIVRVSDGKVLKVVEASANEGGQGMRAAGQSALKKAGADLSSELVRAARKIANP